MVSIASKFIKLSIFLIILLLQVSCSKDSPYVVILSLDGFRWDYAKLTETPNFDRLAEKGSKAKSLQPSYPSKTFPNHYSIATGLYPDNHGIVQNNFYDPVSDKVFRISDRVSVEDSTFWEGEPIWETAERQGVKAASYFWVGSEGYTEYLPSIRKKYDQEVPFSYRVDSVISWLKLPHKDRPHLILFYYHEPDGVGHQYGPQSQEIVQMIEELDHGLGYFLDQLELVQRAEKIEVNFILTSDHGMGAIPEGNYVILEQIIDLNRISRIHGGNPVYLISPEEDYVQEAYDNLKTAEHLKVWYKSELPAHYHYGTSPRIHEIIAEADSGWGLSLKSSSRGYSSGTHGYDPENTDMHGIFYASGPAFKKGYTVSTFQNVCIYSLIAEILNLEPAATDGSLEPLQSILLSKK